MPSVRERAPIAAPARGAAGGGADEDHRSRGRIAADVATLCGPRYTSSATGITRHAYTPEYERTVDFFAHAFRALGYDVHLDPVGTFVASNRGPGEACVGLGSHCDANRGGGPYDGTLGVVCALEVCRLAHERGLDLPFRVIAFLEEEGSGFGSSLLGSRIMLGDVDAAELAGLRDEHGVDFATAATAAGHAPERRDESAAELDGMLAWIEVHIEQGRLLEDRDLELGIVTAIAGYVHGDVTVGGRADHAGGTPMELHSDALVTAGEAIVELDRLTRAVGDDVVGTVGEVDVSPGLINVVPGEVTFSLDVRSASGGHLEALEGILAYARGRAASREQPVRYVERVRVPPTPMDAGVVTTLEAVADEQAVRWTSMVSGAAHDTMLVARRVPAAMVFVPCRDGISHAPEEYSDPCFAAAACRLVLAAAERLVSPHGAAAPAGVAPSSPTGEPGPCDS